MNTGSKDIDTLKVNFRGIEIKAVLVYKNRKYFYKNRSIWQNNCNESS